MNLRHYGNRNARRGFLRPGTGHFRTHGFGLIEQIERRNDAIGNDLPVGSRDEVDAISADGFTDQRYTAFGGLSADIRYRLLDRATAPFGFAVARSSNR